MIIFYTGLSFLTMHELDAIRCKEWRVFPGLSLFNDKVGSTIFVSAHLPLFIWVFYILSQTGFETFESFRTGFDIFMIIHVGLHLLLLKNPKNEFKDWFSWTLISGAGVFGFLDLIFK